MTERRGFFCGQRANRAGARARPGRLHMAALALGLVFLSTAQADGAADVTARILVLEQDGRAHPTEAARALESLLESTAPDGAQRLELLTVEGMVLAEASQTEPAERVADQLDAWGSKPETPLASLAGASALLIRARDKAENGNLHEAAAMIGQALARVPADGPARERYRYLMTQGDIDGEAGKLEDAVRAYNLALALADKQDQTWRRAEVRRGLAHTFYRAGEMNRAQAFATQALRLSQAAGDLVGMGRAYGTMGVVADGLGDHQATRRAYEQAIDCARRAGAKNDEARFLANLSDFYLNVGDYKTALDRAEQALLIARELGDTGSETVALANIGLAQISLQHVELGKRSVQEALAIEERRHATTGMSEIYRDLGTYLEKAGDFRGAIEAFHKHRELANQLIRDDQQKTILALQEQFDAEHRNRELALLNREHELTANRLRRRDLQQRLWAVLSAAALLSFTVVALLYGRVRRSNRRLLSSNEMLKAQGECDPLTGLSNRRHLQTEMSRLSVEGRWSGTMLLLDIDHFKRINDRHGHAAGDAVLVEVARRLREALRQGDLLVRWGGEEFLVVLQAMAPPRLEALVRRLLDTLDRHPVMVGTQRIPVSASIGYATFPPGAGSFRLPWEHAIDMVDAAMYLAKAHGRDRAYGLNLPQEYDQHTVDDITGALEDAWRAGRVALTLLQGRAAPALAA